MILAIQFDGLCLCDWKYVILNFDGLCVWLQILNFDGLCVIWILNLWWVVQFANYCYKVITDKWFWWVVCVIANLSFVCVDDCYFVLWCEFDGLCKWLCFFILCFDGCNDGTTSLVLQIVGIIYLGCEINDHSLVWLKNFNFRDFF
jgi:hypothetical protein